MGCEGSARRVRVRAPGAQLGLTRPAKSSLIRRSAALACPSSPRDPPSRTRPQRPGAAPLRMRARRPERCLRKSPVLDYELRNQLARVLPPSFRELQQFWLGKWCSAVRESINAKEKLTFAPRSMTDFSFAFSPRWLQVLRRDLERWGAGPRLGYVLGRAPKT